MRLMQKRLQPLRPFSGGYNSGRPSTSSRGTGSHDHGGPGSTCSQSIKPLGSKATGIHALFRKMKFTLLSINIVKASYAFKSH